MDRRKSAEIGVTGTVNTARIAVLCMDTAPNSRLVMAATALAEELDGLVHEAEVACLIPCFFPPT